MRQQIGEHNTLDQLLSSIDRLGLQAVSCQPSCMLMIRLQIKHLFSYSCYNTEILLKTTITLLMMVIHEFSCIWNGDWNDCIWSSQCSCITGLISLQLKQHVNIAMIIYIHSNLHFKYMKVHMLSSTVYLTSTGS